MQKASLVNIPSTIEDSNYRYKMPRVLLKIEGKGNGIKTNLVNLHEVAKALRCPDEYPLKYLGYELGSQTHYSFKNENDVTCIINGAFTDDVIRKFLDKFIEKYILCPSCKYPEMFIKVKREKPTGSCECCGTKCDLDNVHRLAIFIVKNPPKAFKSLQAGMGDTNKTTNTNGEPGQVKKAKAKIMTADDLQLGSEILETNLSFIRETFIRQLSNEDIVFDLDLAQLQIIADIKSCNVEKGLYDRVCFLIFQSMFDINIAKQVSRNQQLLSELYKKVEPPQPEVHILLNIQYLMTSLKVEDKYIPTVLKLFYDEELLDGEFLTAWGDDKNWCDTAVLEKHFLWNKEQNDKFRAASVQIIEWLKQEEEEEDEDQLEIVKE